MSVKELLEPILEQGIRHTNYFEGRLLTGEDLRDQQNADRERDRRLGRAIGSGIIEGLEVTLDNERDGSDGNPPVVTVTKGLAINPDGEIIGLPHNDVKLALSKIDPAVEIDEADFYACAGPPGSQHLPNGAGIYILVMSQAAGYKERAPKSGLGDGGFVKGCGSRYVQEGVNFRLEMLESISSSSITLGEKGIFELETAEEIIQEAMNRPDVPTKTTPERLSILRNGIAHLLCSTKKVFDSHADPLKGFSDTEFTDTNKLAYGEFISETLNSCDVPLAIVYWTLSGVQFIDVWAIRRMLINNENVSAGLGAAHSKSVAYARLRQFQDHINVLVDDETTTPVLKILDYFRWLPPLGMIPIAGYGFSRGVDIDSFLEGKTSPIPVFVEGSEVTGMIHDSYFASPIDLATETLIWRYVIRENIQKSSGIESNRPEPLVVFASSVMSLYGEARYNAKYWNFGNYQ